MDWRGCLKNQLMHIIEITRLTANCSSTSRLKEKLNKYFLNSFATKILCYMVLQKMVANYSTGGQLL